MLRNPRRRSFSMSATSVPRVKNGQLKGLAVTGKERIEALPGIPTVGELGFPELALSVWYGLVAPARTPPEVVELLLDLSLQPRLDALSSVTEVAAVRVRPHPYEFALYFDS